MRNEEGDGDVGAGAWNDTCGVRGRRRGGGGGEGGGYNGGAASRRGTRDWEDAGENQQQHQNHGSGACGRDLPAAAAAVRFCSARPVALFFPEKKTVRMMCAE